MAISPQRITIYLYSAHRAVIFAIAQLSCKMMHAYFQSLRCTVTLAHTIKLEGHCWFSLRSVFYIKYITVTYSNFWC